jgi:hypothetical protein
MYFITHILEFHFQNPKIGQQPTNNNNINTQYINKHETTSTNIDRYPTTKAAHILIIIISGSTTGIVRETTVRAVSLI